MFDYNKMLQRAIEFFPRWTDIRKRYKTSSGGNILGAALEESLKIEDAIKEYIDSYFLDTYEGHEDEVMAFSYMTKIGKVDDLDTIKINYNDEDLMLTTDAKIFEKDIYANYAYYEDGIIHIKESLYRKDVPLLITIDDSTSEYKLDKHHVWNIFDEFATFVNTRRYEDETNKELLDRILYITKNLPNGTELGLKHAIISELMRFDPEISEDDIKIERATPQNLIKPYEDYESLLEKLMYINRDVYKCKRWDYDFWQYDFESISYIPHKWNEALTVWQNGIGGGDDLEVVISNSDIDPLSVPKTDAKLTLYNKSYKMFEKYIQNKDVPYDVDFKMTKYNSILNKANIKYRIKASEVMDITNEDINLYIYESNKVDEIINIEDVLSFASNIDKKEVRYKAEDLNYYKLKFVQKPDVDFKITRAQVQYFKTYRETYPSNDEEKEVLVEKLEDVVDLIKNQNGFIINAEKELVSKTNSKIIRKVEEFNYSNKLMNTDNGITIADNEIEGNAILSCEKYAGMYMTVDCDCDNVNVPEHLITATNAYWKDGEDGFRELFIRGENSTEAKTVTINLEANAFTFKVKNMPSGVLGVVVVENGIQQDEVFLKNQDVFSIEESSVPRKLQIIISALSFNDIILSNFEYSNYMISIDTDAGLTFIDKNHYRLPSNFNNNLHIKMKTVTGKKPYLRKISIGESENEVAYVTNFIEARSQCDRKFDIKANADVYLLKYEPINNIKPDIILESQLKCNEILERQIKDDIENFINNHEILSTLEDEIKNVHVQNTIEDIKNYLYSCIDFESVLSIFDNKLIQKSSSSNEIMNALISHMNAFLNDHRGDAFISFDGIGPFSIMDICNYLNKDELGFLDKAEWIAIAEDLAIVLLDIASEKCLKDMGPLNFKTVYIGNSNTQTSFVRLDLSEYETIDTIIPDGGTYEIEHIPESGNVYYNIVLNNGASASTVRIIGTRNKEARVIPLEDMIKFYISDFDRTNDKILCSKLIDSVIISRSNPGATPYNTLIKLGSNMVQGIAASKYQLKLPDYIGSRYGTNTLSSNASKVNYQTFDYISFYPSNGEIYEAINEYDSYLEDNRDIKIVNNFSPSVNTYATMIYTIENFDKADKNKHIIRFHSDVDRDKDIYELDSWCIGQQSIAIYNTIDLNNDLSYSLNTYDINSKELLSTMIDIKDVYRIADTMILDTTQYIIEPPEGLTIKYEEYNGSESKSHLLKTEMITVNESRFNKLTYANIDGLYHISKHMPDDMYIKDNYEFDLLEKQGIIIWGNNVPVGTTIYMVYSIKKPVGFIIDLENLYKAVNYDIEAYNRLDVISLTDLESEDYYSYDNIKNIDEVDLIHIDCSNPTFKGIIDNNERKIEFVRYIDQKNILIKTGYYYIDGREYYLYSEDEKESVANNEYYTSENIDISGGEILTYKPTNNFVSNTEMRLKGKASIYNFDCKKDLDYGISKLNALTACNSYNAWTYFETIPSLVPGTNGLAMKFEPLLDCAYSYLDITDALSDKETNYISLFASSGLKIYIGEEAPYLDINFSRTLNLTLKEEIVATESDMRVISIAKKPNNRCYLVVLGEGVLDDIIITTNKTDALYGHNKNISLLGLDLTESKMQGTTFRISIDDNKDYTPHEAAMMSNGYFKTTSKIDWYITEVKSFNKENDFYSCMLDNVNVASSYISTNDAGGSLITPPIYINNTATIKRLVFKVNDIELPQMKGFNISSYTSNSYDGEYYSIGDSKDNKFYILSDDLMEYVKFKIEIPANKIISNIEIFVEYKSSEENVLKLPVHESGYIESKIYDLQDTLDYRLKDLGIEDISNINDIEIYIRASRDIDKLEVWHNWQRIGIKEDLSLERYMKFYDVRFMQLKIVLKTRKSYIKFKHLDVEVI